jgi:hypothetical protein
MRFDLYPEKTTADGAKLPDIVQKFRPALTDQKNAQVSSICRNSIKINILQLQPAPFSPNNRLKKTALARNLR